MKSTIKQRLSQQVDKLIDEGEALLKTKFSVSHGSYIDLSDPYVDLQLFRTWHTTYHNLVSKIGNAAKVWIDLVSAPASNQFVVASSLLGALRALKRAIDDEILDSIEDLVYADAFSDLLEQADELVGKGHVLAAGVVCRAVLEEHLRKLCDRRNCLPAGKPTIEPLKQALAKSGILDKIGVKAVDAMAAVGNHCAHNNQPPLDEAAIRKLHRDVIDFVARTPLT